MFDYKNDVKDHWIRHLCIACLTIKWKLFRQTLFRKLDYILRFCCSYVFNNMYFIAKYTYTLFKVINKRTTWKYKFYYTCKDDHPHIFIRVYTRINSVASRLREINKFMPKSL